MGEPPEGQAEIYEDNQGATSNSMAKNPVGHARTKHIGIRYHFVRFEIHRYTRDDCCHPYETFA